MKNNFSFIISKISYLFFMASLVILPLIMLPITNNFIIQSKTFFIFAVALITGIIFFLKALKNQSWKLILSPASLPLLIFALSSAASTFFTNKYPVKALLGMGGIYLSASIIALLGGSLFSLSKSLIVNANFLSYVNSISSLTVVVSSLILLGQMLLELLLDELLDKLLKLLLETELLELDELLDKLLKLLLETELLELDELLDELLKLLLELDE